MSVFIAVPMTASALTGNDVQSLLSSMEAMIDGYMDQQDWDHAGPLIEYHNQLVDALNEANGEVTPVVESRYNAAYTYFTENGGTVSGGQGGSGGSGGSYPDVNNVYMATDRIVEVTVSDLERGDVIVKSPEPMEIQKGDCSIVLVGGTYGDGDMREGTLSQTYTDDVKLDNEVRFEFMDDARITNMDNYERYVPVYNNALGNAYIVLGNDNGTVYLAGYNYTTYTITWKDYNGSNLYDGQSTVAPGTVPYYRWSVSRDSTAQYSYTFTGWTDSSNTFYSKDNDLPAATKDETYTATYSQTLRSYTITWKDGDNNTLKSESVAYGTTPSYTGETPTKTEDGDYTYEFNNTWSPSVASVTGNATYTAQFTAVPKSDPAHTEHTYVNNPTFNWTQDANGDWNCDKLTLTCSGCDATDDYEVKGYFGTSAVTVTANADGSFTYSVSKKVGDVTYNDSKTYNAGGVVKSSKQLTAAAKKGGSWELGSDIDGAVNVVCADGFVLDGKDHTVIRNSNVDTNPVFRITANPAEVTIKNLTIDGISGRSNTKSAIATKQSNPSSGNVLNLENVTITNYDMDQANNGVVLAWGQSTVNMKDCTVVNPDSTHDVWGGAASKVNVDGGKVGGLYLNGGTSSANLTNNADVESITAANGSKIYTDSPEKISVGEGYKLKDNGDGTYTVVPKDLQDKVDADFSVHDSADVRFVDGTGQSVEIVSKAQILGVQLRKTPADGGVYTDGASNGIRFITAVNKEFLNAHPEIVNYGYNVTINGTTKFFSVKNTTNNVIKTNDNAAYNYYTFAITNIPEDNSDEIKVQFVFTTDGSTVAAKAAYKNASGAVSHELVTNYADVKNY